MPSSRPFWLRSPWRVPVIFSAMLAALALAYLAWTPGATVEDGRHDFRRNGAWLGHAWLGDDAWFARNAKAAQKIIREPAELDARLSRLRAHGVRDLFPHLCPAGRDGSLPSVDAVQVERLLDRTEGMRVLPWIGGVFGDSARTGDAAWRARFCAEAAELIRRHPRLAGVQVNIEPCPSGTESFLRLLEEMRAALPAGKILSVAAYPPPTRWQPSVEVHWDEVYFRAVAGRVDQLAVMMYDTGIRWRKPYVRLMSDWTGEVLAWSEGREVLLGVPAYDDAGTGWHNPDVENLRTALAGIHAGLNVAKKRGYIAPYAGIAIYSEWEMDADEWAELEASFGRPAGAGR